MRWPVRRIAWAHWSRESLRKMPVESAAARTPVPGAASQLKLKIAFSNSTFGTTGGVRKTRPCKYGQGKLRVTLFSMAFTGGRPQMKTATVSIIQGTQALTTSEVERETTCTDGPLESSPGSEKGLFGFQTSIRQARHAIDSTPPRMSVSSGPI